MKAVQVPATRDVALLVANLLMDKYGDASDHPNVAEGLWLAMQLVGGPQQAANVMRYCGVNFADK